MSRSGPMLLTFALTLFVSALALFLVQPLIGKLIVPLLGGFPSVWNTCMVFFQAMLLAGYAYAHFSTAYFGERQQAKLHLIVLLLPLVVLTPLGVFTSLVPAGEDNPVPGLLLLLFASAGLPFFAVSTTAPLLQRWFAATDHPDARDPYFLYAASNIGSMLALLGYPLFIEPNLTLYQQRVAWSITYVVLVAFIGFCAVLLWKSRPPVAPKVRSQSPKAPGKEGAKPSEAVQAARPSGRGSDAIQTSSPWKGFIREFAGPSLSVPSISGGDDLSWGRVLRWVALAAVPSTLMLGATTHITTDIAAIPMFWVLPLALYLMSFILVFSRLPSVVHKIMVLALPVLLLLLVFVMISKMKTQMWMVITLHLLVLFTVAMVCHGELARTRPAVRHLTKFYLWMSFGGVVGGFFNALFAPVVFNTLAEYPIAMIVAGLLLPRLDDEERDPTRSFLLDLTLPIGLAIFAVEMFNGFHVTEKVLGTSVTDKVQEWLVNASDSLNIKALHLRTILVFAPPVVFCYAFVERPLRFGLGLAVLFFAAAMPSLFDKEVVYRGRSFFGVLNVKESPEAYLIRTRTPDGKQEEETREVPSRRLLHGNILHGTQYLDEEHRDVPLTYYHRTGPIGQLLAAFEGKDFKKDIAVIGLGTGTMACYAMPERPDTPEKKGNPARNVTFYEIDRKVKWVSFDQDTYFTYVQDAKKRGAKVEIVLGDARLSLDRERESKPEEKFDVIVVDAFSSDAIPVHLITKEALQILLDKVKPGGIVAFHTSNRYLRLDPVVANIATALDCVALGQHDYNDDPPGKSVSSWVMVARDKAHFGKLLENTKAGPEDKDKPWELLEPDKEVGVWTDDFSNLLAVFNFGGT